ncbi:CaiB/BaiF CoA transferase family protein [Sphingobium cloacae]|uniref:CoA transferase n=1 Tax=Sphingobium cloacae TaxID=120107 RepID=A0A1E1EY33_9SPHN|nr:CaiB/BaiF CoA-transferase family protein [Sphingobium cloacae]BAV63112.1 CoA transferase [Sphingobium cloacae]
MGSDAPSDRPGVLSGLRIIEMGGIGPGPFAGMMLADHGAEVIRIDRPGGGAYYSPKDVLNRSRRSIAIDLKSPAGVEVVRDLCRSAEGLIEGFRPGVMERMGLGPEVLRADNPALVYGRVTGWGQSGPYAQMAGHDLNYIAITGALHACGAAGGKPAVPLNLFGDFGGGGMMLAFGMVSAILQARATGNGQVVDCAMVDGASTLMAMIWRFRAEGRWNDERGTNFLDGGAHYYDSFETADGKYVSIAAVEPQFYALLREKLGLLSDEEFDAQNDKARWPYLKAKLEAIFKSRTRAQWCDVFEGTDACFAPVLSMAEAAGHSHLAQRETLVDIDGIVQPAPSPRFDGTPAATPIPAPIPGAHSRAVLESIGYSQEQIADLVAQGTIATPKLESATI